MLLQRTPMLRGLPMLRGSPPMLLLLRGPLLLPRTPPMLRGPPMLLLLPRTLMLLLPPKKTLRMRSWRCGGGEEGDKGGRSRAEMRRVWTVGQATSISVMYSISV